MKNTDFRTLLYGYFDDMQGVVQMNLGIEDDGRDWFKDEDWRNAIIEDLTDKVKKQKKDLEKQQELFDEKINDFYNPKSPYEIYGINEDVFH